MNEDFLDPINAEGMPQLADASFATEFLIRVKNGVRNCAFAISETATPEVRAVLQRQLKEALNLHTELTDLMVHKGWFHPHELNEQFRLDLVTADTTLKIASLELYPEETSRLGTFATPNK